VARILILAVPNLGTIVLTTEIAVHKLTVYQHSQQATLTQCPVLNGLETRECTGVLQFLLPLALVSLTTEKEPSTSQVGSPYPFDMNHLTKRLPATNDRLEKPSTS